MLLNLLIKFRVRFFIYFTQQVFSAPVRFPMKILFPLICLLIFSASVAAQDKPLPKEIVKILNENFPTFRYDYDWEYDKMSAVTNAAFTADFNNDGVSDYGVFIEFAKKKKLVLFLKQGRRYKTVAVDREAVLAVNKIKSQALATNRNNMDDNFYKNLPDNFNLPKDNFGLKILREYGALFIARPQAIVPKSVFFKDDAEVSAFQNNLKIGRLTIGRFDIELQEAAMNAMKNAIDEAGRKGLRITTRDYDAGRRSYNETVGLWFSRVEPALEYWTGNGRISLLDADKLRKMNLSEQIPEIFKLEEDGIYFSKDLSKPIMYSVAPPGTSQHLSMLAIDINEYDNPTIQQILARNGWHQTVISDLPHFTYLGATENELPNLGLKKVMSGGRFYWIPNI